MTTAENYINERLDHLGIVAGVCQEIGLAAWLDAQDPGYRQQVSVGTATVAQRHAPHNPARHPVAGNGIPVPAAGRNLAAAAIAVR